MSSRPCSTVSSGRGHTRASPTIIAARPTFSIGQEAAAVGQSFHLRPDDFIFGSHRSHGEILAKSFSAIAKMNEDDLIGVMEGYMDGAPLRVVETFSFASAKEQAIDFILYGTLAEIFGREIGFNKGMGGSMHAFFAPFGVMPNNAIVGGSADIAVGAALFKRVNRKPGLVIANIGDAAMGCGPVWEAIIFASMDQYRTLWDSELGGNPPIIFNFMNNFYGMGGQPQGETMGLGMLARVGMGVNAEAMHAERVDGYNPLAVADAVARKRAILETGRGPVLLDTVTYRFSGHSPSDASAYRDRSEIELWRQQDGLLNYGQYLIENGHADRALLESYQADITERLTKVLAAAVSEEISPRICTVGDAIGAMMFSNQARDRMAEGRPEVRFTREESRLQQTQTKQRFGLDERGKPLSGLRAVYLCRRALRGHDAPLLYRPHHDRLWRGEPGLGRRVRRLPRPDRVSALSSAVQRAHFGRRNRRHGGGLCPERWARGGGTYVLRLHGARRR